MNKTLTVIKPYGWMEPGETFELSEDGKMYTNTHTTEYNSVCKNNDITSKATTVYSISPDFAKALIEGLKSEVIIQNDNAKKYFPNITPIFILNWFRKIIVVPVLLAIAVIFLKA